MWVCVQRAGIGRQELTQNAWNVVEMTRPLSNTAPRSLQECCKQHYLAMQEYPSSVPSIQHGSARPNQQ